MMKLGLHISTSGNLIGTPARAHSMGAEVIQIFASNPRSWRPTSYSPEQGESFQRACHDAAISSSWIHMIYLVSYGNEAVEQRDKSVTAMKTMLANADVLGVNGVITHMGSHKGAGFLSALPQLTESYTRILDDDSTSRMLLENSAGGGGNIGNSLEELATMLEAMKGHPRLNVCIDTAHAFTSGYDLRTPEGVDKFVNDFDRIIGLERLNAVHLNDSKAELGSHLDRHENIGDGQIGLTGLLALIHHPKLDQLPAILEVPGLDGNGPDQANLDRLKVNS
jgi:deoxyribonuclease-4